MATTLGDARKLFGSLAGANNSFTDRLNQVQARILPEGTFRGTKVGMRYAVYRDARGNHFITTPNEIESVLAGAYEPCGPTGPTGATGCTGPRWWGGRPLAIRNGWYEYSEGGPGLMLGTNWETGIIRIEGRFTTFAEWDTAMRLRIKPERDESPGGSVIFRGRALGEKIYSVQANDAWLEGFALAYTDQTIVTSTQTVEESPYQIIKPVTKGRLRVYIVDDDDNETLVGDYAPDETGPSYIRYKVPSPVTTD